MRHSSWRWIFGGFPLLVVGVVALMLLPGAPNNAAAPAPAASSARTVPPSILAAAAAQAREPGPAHVTAAALEVPLVQPPKVIDIHAVGMVAPKLAANWSAYVVPGMMPAVAPAAPAAAPDAPQGTVSAQIGAQAVNARSGPSSGSDVKFVVQAGEAIRIGESSGGWLHVYRSTGEDGWVYSRYVDAPPSRPDAAAAPTAVTASR